MKQSVQFFTVTNDESGQRLDNYLVSRLKGLPKSALYKVIRKGEVRVNKGRAKPDRKLAEGDVVRVPPVRIPDEKTHAKPSFGLSQHLSSAVIYDRDGLLIINKPSGLAVHGGSGVHLGLIEALRQLPGNEGFLELIHRLDKETSGCVMIARKRSVLKYFQEALRKRSNIKKTYWALVQGQWPEYQKAVSAPLQRILLPNGDRIVNVHKDGKPSKTNFAILECYPQATLVEAQPVTGRTHQIRVHAKHMGCPLVGDSKYGDIGSASQFEGLGVRRLFLHARALSFELPSGEKVEVDAPLPEDLTGVLATLKA